MGAVDLELEEGVLVPGASCLGALGTEGGTWQVGVEKKAREEEGRGVGGTRNSFLPSQAFPGSAPSQAQP